MTQAERDELTRQWWAYCEKNQRTLPVIPTFKEWLVQHQPEKVNDLG